MIDKLCFKSRESIPNLDGLTQFGNQNFVSSIISKYDVKRYINKVIEFSFHTGEKGCFRAKSYSSSPFSLYIIFHWSSLCIYRINVFEFYVFGFVLEKERYYVFVLENIYFHKNWYIEYAVMCCAVTTSQ